MRCVAIVQARLGSSRLPNKVLALIEGKPMIQHVVERAQAIRGVNHVTLAVPEEELVEFYLVRAETGCGLVGGPRDDVLARYALAAGSSHAKVIVRLTGDCPLIAPDVCQDVLDHREWKEPFASNDTRISGYPDGLDCEVFSKEMLELAHARATAAHDREHVTPWMSRNSDWPLIIFAPTGERGPWPKLSVDTQEDLDRVRRIMARIPAGDYSWAATRKAIEEETSC